MLSLRPPSLFPLFIYFLKSCVRGRVQNSSLADRQNLPNDKLTATATTTKKLKPVTRETEKQQREVQINISRAGTRPNTEGRGDNVSGRRGVSILFFFCFLKRYDRCRWMETIKIHSEGGAEVTHTQQRCRYVTKPKTHTPPPGECVWVHMI